MQIQITNEVQKFKVHIFLALHELRGLVHDLLRKEAKGTCLSCGADSNEKIRMEVQLHKTQEQNDKLERRLKEQEDLNKRKDDELLEVKSKVSAPRIGRFCQILGKLKTKEVINGYIKSDLHKSKLLTSFKTLYKLENNF